jgi:predicted acyl esterase
MSSILIEKNLMIPMRDGVKLATDVYRLNGAVPMPVLIARNSNTGGDIVHETADQYQPAINRIFHDAAHPSRLILPIIER